MPNESLRVVSGNAAGTEIELDSDEFLIGRIAEGDGKLGDDPEISRHHARIVRRAGGQLSVEDLGSTNGTFVNGRRIEAPHKLTPGDTVKVGMTTLQLLDPSGQAPQATRLGAGPAPGDTPTAVGAQPPSPRPQPVEPPAAPPRPPRAPAGGEPPGAPPFRPQQQPAGAGRRRGILALGAALLVAAVAVAGVLLTGGDDDEPAKPRILSTRQIVAENSAATVKINTRGPGRDSNGNKITEAGGGTGMVVDARRGLVLTNQHVVAGQTSIKVEVKGDEVNATLRGQAPCEDLAVLELRPNPGRLTQVRLGRTRSVRPGDRVTALGYPGAFEEDIRERKLQATDGTASSAVAPATISATLPKFPALLQHQVPISPGNSGGPLFNRRGEVIGVNTVGSTGAGGRQNQNGAIAIDRVKPLLADLKADRNSGYVGWDVTPISTGRTEGLFVTGVDPDSPAERANLEFADVILEVDDTKVTSVADACDIIGSKSAGDRLKISGISLRQQAFFTIRARLR